MLLRQSWALKILVRGQPTRFSDIEVIRSHSMSEAAPYDPTKPKAAFSLREAFFQFVPALVSLRRRGDLTRYVSHAVIVGFTLGAAVLLVLDQLKNLLGIPAAGTGADHFLKRVWLSVSHVDQTNRTALFVGLATVGIALALRW